MSEPLRIPIGEAAAPHALLPFLEGEHCFALDAGMTEGWLSAPGAASPGVSVLGCAPEAVFAGGLQALRKAREWLRSHGDPSCAGAWLVGYLSYDLARDFECLPFLPPGMGNGTARDPLPRVWLAGTRALYRYADGCGEVAGGDPDSVHSLLERVQKAQASRGPLALPSLPTPKALTTDRDYRAAIARIQHWIRAGDVYQVNLSRRLDLAPVERECTRALYARLCARHPAPFSAYLDTGAATLISNSPERFLRQFEDQIETCPIKGTRPRGRTPEEDRLLQKELLASEKDAAEHLMIVDLERNDLGRVCHTGTIRVERLAELRSFAHVHHLVSSVRGVLREPEDWETTLAATFPGGSITGAPKLRAMEIIEELEPVRRGAYTGAIGLFDSSGEIDLSIAIRTAVHRGDSLHLHLGGGIVADSDPEAELAETRDKGRSFASLWEGD